MTYPSYNLTLHKTYYEKGFFNLGVDVDKYTRKTNGPITLCRGPTRQKLLGTVNRDANQNGTPRIMAGVELRNWFFKHYSLGDNVKISVESPNNIHIL